MKKFILSLFFVIFALFNVCGEDLLHPVIRDDIDEDIKKIEQALVDYVLYPELVERGFDIHRLDNMKIDGEMFEYIESFFRPNDEKGWCALDNHHELSIKDENGKWFSSQSYKRRVNFSKEYGTKDELLKKGYVENETMFYYPSNGEKDWRVGEWQWGWYNKSGEWKWNNDASSILSPFYENNMSCISSDYNLFILETKKSYVIKYSTSGMNSYLIENIKSFPKKDNLIIDMTNGNGGSGKISRNFAETIKNSKFKKIIILTDNTRSASEDLLYRLRDDKRVIRIGNNTNGVIEAGDTKHIKIQNNVLFLSTYDCEYPELILYEGIGWLPNIWAANKDDVIINILSITNDMELFPSTSWKVKQHLMELGISIK